MVAVPSLRPQKEGVTKVAQTRVVIADDESIIRMDLKEMLSGLGYQVVGEAGDGRQAINLSRELKPDLVIMDIKMPEMDGIALLKVIQKRFPQVKVYICTAFDTPFLRKNSAEKGALRFFTKPLDFKALRTALLEDFAAEDAANGVVK